jgi:hypothetical protein
MQYGVAARPHGTKQTVEEDPFSPVCQGLIPLFAGSLIFASDDGVLGSDRVLGPSGTETW